jgi:hypothetical protein
MRRVALLTFAVVALLGLAAVALVAGGERRQLAFTLGVPVQGVSLIVRPGQTACQAPIPAAGSFDEVSLIAGTYDRPGPPLTVTVRDADGRLLGEGRVPAGFHDVEPQSVDVGHVDASGDLSVCIANDGDRKIGLFGGADAFARTSSATLDGRPQQTDLRLQFLRAEPHSTLAAIGDVIDRAALFRGGWIGPWLYWLLLAGVLLGVPLLLGLALRGAGDDRADGEPPR